MQVQQFLVGKCPIHLDTYWQDNTILFTYTAHKDYEEPEYLIEPPFRYVWVGGSVFEFDLPERVFYYVSRVGNSAVPYPHAVTKSKTYLLGNCHIEAIENVRLPFTPPNYDEYTALVTSKGYDAIHDNEVRSVDPRA